MQTSKPYHIILASNSPRRKELLKGLNLSFEVRVKQGISEDYPDTCPINDVAQYIAQKKADAYDILPNELLITADTIVVLDGEIMGKPHNEDHAKRMLARLSGKTHQVITGVCLKTYNLHRSFSVVTNVTFKQLSADEINFYVSTYQPLDKAGAYGIQEWIGYIGVTKLEGSYFNVMGLPVQRIYQELQQF